MHDLPYICDYSNCEISIIYSVFNIPNYVLKA